MPKTVDNEEAKRALTAAWERFTATMTRIRKSVMGVMSDIDERRRAKDIEETKKRLDAL